MADPKDLKYREFLQSYSRLFDKIVADAHGNTAQIRTNLRGAIDSDRETIRRNIDRGIRYYGENLRLHRVLPDTEWSDTIIRETMLFLRASNGAISPDDFKTIVSNVNQTLFGREAPLFEDWLRENYFNLFSILPNLGRNVLGVYTREVAKPLPPTPPTPPEAGVIVGDIRELGINPEEVPLVVGQRSFVDSLFEGVAEFFGGAAAGPASAPLPIASPEEPYAAQYIPGGAPSDVPYVAQYAPGGGPLPPPPPYPPPRIVGDAIRNIALRHNFDYARESGNRHRMDLLRAELTTSADKPSVYQFLADRYEAFSDALEVANLQANRFFDEYINLDYPYIEARREAIKMGDLVLKREFSADLDIFNEQIYNKIRL